MRFKDKIAIVSGGGQGIGEGIAVALGAEGANVVVFDINEEGAKNTAKQIIDAGGKAQAMKVNAINYDETKAAMDQVIQQLGHVDIMITTVGGGKFGPFVDYTPEFWKQQLDLNLTSTFNNCHAIIKHMMDRNYGKILTFISETGGMPGLAAYEASKAAVQSLTLTLSAEVAANKVNVNMLMPGMTDTPLTRGAFEEMGEAGDQMMEQIVAMNPWGWNTPDKVAKLALFLVSDDAERLTGQELQSR
jgi:NAD(P)-dependent dehydrogenase (short-subunit alcohol dehydrogenase family)